MRVVMTHNNSKQPTGGQDACCQPRKMAHLGTCVTCVPQVSTPANGKRGQGNIAPHRRGAGAPCPPNVDRRSGQGREAVIVVWVLRPVSVGERGGLAAWMSGSSGAGCFTSGRFTAVMRPRL